MQMGCEAKYNLAKNSVHIGISKCFKGLFVFLFSFPHVGGVGSKFGARRHLKILPGFGDTSFGILCLLVFLDFLVLKSVLEKHHTILVDLWRETFCSHVFCDLHRKKGMGIISRRQRAFQNFARV